jgi:hypothetical protein
MSKVLTGKEARDTLSMILDRAQSPDADTLYGPPFVAGHYIDNGTTCVAFDNTDGNCWVEEFRSQYKAMRWIQGETDAD